MSSHPPASSSAAADVALPWASVVRGDSEENLSPMTVVVGLGHVNSSESPIGNSLTESSDSDDPPESGDVNGDGRRRTAWNRPVNGVVEPVSVMGGGAISWPTLSETNRPVTRSLVDNSSRPVSDGSVSVSQVALFQTPILTQPNVRPANGNVHHTNSSVSSPAPSRPRTRNRNGSNNHSGIGPSQNAFNHHPPPYQMPPPFPFSMVPPPVLDTSGVRGTRPMGGGHGGGGSSSHNGNDRNRRGGYSGRSRGEGQYNNNHGGRHDHGRRDVHHPPPPYPPPPPPPMGYIPSHLLPGVPPFIAPPPMRVFPGQMGFDMTSPFMYYPPMPPESFRPMPMVPPPPGPPSFPGSNDPSPFHGSNDPPPFPVSNDPPPFPGSNEDSVSVTNSILRQIEFYFSDDNLVNDNFLRSKMDDQGWVSVALIATFRRVQQWTRDIPLILESLRYSTVVEVKGEYVRRRDDWQKWLPHPELVNSDSGSRVSSLMTNLRGVSLGDTSSNVNSNEGAVGAHGGGQSSETSV